MFNKTRLFLLLLAVCTGTGFAQEVPQKLVLPSLDKSPAPANFSFLCEKLSQKQPAKLLAPAELDVRACEELADVLTFDSQTKFPPKAKLPKNFSAKKILKNGKNPGLGIKKLHKKGITGKGVSAAIIDQNLLTTHQEYAKQLVWYEENEWWHNLGGSSMHAPAVASILAGKTTGVAPQVRLFLFAPAMMPRQPPICCGGLFSSTSNCLTKKESAWCLFHAGFNQTILEPLTFPPPKKNWKKAASLCLPPMMYLR